MAGAGHIQWSCRRDIPVACHGGDELARLLLPPAGRRAGPWPTRRSVRHSQTGGDHMAERGVHVAIKRAYEAPTPTDGMRVLVDRLWPRGLSKERARVDLWLKDVAPSTEQRTWYGHDPARFAAFRERYVHELEGEPGRAALHQLRAL